MNNKRLSFVNFPIPFDHPYTLPVLTFSVCASACAYYYLQASHLADLLEARRIRDIRHRRQLKHPKDRYASMKFDTTFVNPFEEWEEPSWRDKVAFWWSWYRLGLSRHSTQPTPGLYLDSPLSSDPTKQALSESWVQLGTPASESPSSPPSHTSSFTWLGQSTCLLRFVGLTILVDPVFGDWIVQTPSGSRKDTGVPCSRQDILSNVDVVLITHDHVGHLDEKIVKALGDRVTWYTPTGLREWFNALHVQNVIELDWWQEIHHKERPEVLIACTPAMHGSGRLFEEGNRSLWCGYVIKTKEECLFFCGNSGYSPDMFKAIRKVHEPFSFVVLPADNRPFRNVLCDGQMDYTDALKAHCDLGSPRAAVYIHHDSPPKQGCLRIDGTMSGGAEQQQTPSMPGDSSQSNQLQAVVPGELVYLS